MNKNLRWKLLTVVVVFLVFFALGVYPIVGARYGLPVPAWLAAKQLKLGLDLKGGVHLVMRVQTDEALQLTTTTTSEQIREELRNAGITVANISTASPTTFQVDGVPPDKDSQFRTITDAQAGTNYNRNPGANGSYVFEMKPNIANDLREQAVVQARETIERRVNELGAAEPTIALYGQSRDQILVQLPGIADVARAKEIIRSTALLELKLVEFGPAPTREALLQSAGGAVPGDAEVLPDANGQFYLVKKVAAVTGRDLRSAKPSLDENNRPAVSFTLTSDGSRKFGKATGENIGKSLAIVLDKRVRSAPRIDGKITDQGTIYGSFTTEEVNDLSLTLRSGALPASLSYLEERVIGPSLGADSIRAGVLSSLAGLALIIVFMLIYYKLSGINAVLALVMNLIILIGLMAYVDATMTLPGIAGFVLTMGIGVDSNVLIFERIKEEFEAGRGVRAAINSGFNHVLWTLLDTHATAFISGLCLMMFGTGPIRGFAVTLMLGLAANLFTSVFVSKTLFEFELSRRQTPALSI